MFVLREAIRSIKRTPGTFIMSVLALGISVGLGAFLASAALQAHERLSDAQSALKVQAFFDPAISSTDAASIAQSRVQPMPAVSRIVFITKEQALQDFATSTGENVENVLGMNPLPASVTVYLKEPSAGAAEQLRSALEKVEGVATVRTDVALLRVLESRTELLQTLAIIFGALSLSATLFFLILAGRYTLAIRADTEQVLQSLGASRSQVRLPLTIESVCAGFLGGLLAALVLIGVQQLVLNPAGAQIITASTPREIALLAAASILAAILVSIAATRIARLTS